MSKNILITPTPNGYNPTINFSGDVNSIVHLEVLPDGNVQFLNPSDDLILDINAASVIVGNDLSVCGDLNISGGTNLDGNVVFSSLSGYTERVVTTTTGELEATLELEDFTPIELSTALATYTGDISCSTLTVTSGSTFNGITTFSDLIAIGSLYITPSGSTTDTGSWKLEINGSELKLERYNGSSWDWSTTFTI